MIRRNTNWTAKPFLLKPAGKDYLWGGTRLNDDFRKDIPLSPLAETWECSIHPDGLSLVASGEHAGKTLKETLDVHPEYLGERLARQDGLPILIKFIDAKEDLSIQVHPDDAYAAVNENGSLGKTEMWYVLDAEEDTRISYGFNHDITRESLEKSLREGSVEKYLQKVKAHKDDVFFIPAGTVHGLGAGALVAEIQECSNITYRLYDYDRVDKDGKPRRLHIEKAADVANLSGSDKPRQPMRTLKYKKGSALELLCRCKYFQVERMLLNTEHCREMVDYRTRENSFQVLLCLKGCGSLFMEKGGHLNFFKGDCIFVPARSVPVKLHGCAQLLLVGC